MDFFRATALLNISKLNSLALTPNFNVATLLNVVRFIDEAEKLELINTFYDYKLFCTLNPINNIEELNRAEIREKTFLWFYTHRENKNLPRIWFKFNTAFLFLPSSAGAERVFSMVQQMFRNNQSNTLNDTFELSIMTRYNDLWRFKYDNLLL